MKSSGYNSAGREENINIYRQKKKPVQKYKEIHHIHRYTANT